MTKARTPESRGNVFTLFTGCAQIYHQRWYVRSPRVEYSLSETGITLKPILRELCEWGKTYQEYQNQ